MSAEASHDDTVQYQVTGDVRFSNVARFGNVHIYLTSSATWTQQDITYSHYIDVIMTTMAYQITSLTVVYSTVYPDADQRKHQSSASLAFVWGIHRTGEFPAQRPVTRKMFPFDDVIMYNADTGETSGFGQNTLNSPSLFVWVVCWRKTCYNGTRLWIRMTAKYRELTALFPVCSGGEVCVCRWYGHLDGTVASYWRYQDSASDGDQGLYTMMTSWYENDFCPHYRPFVRGI